MIYYILFIFMVKNWSNITIKDLKNDESLKEKFAEEFAPHLICGYANLRSIEDDKIIFDKEFIISEEDHVEELDLMDDYIEKLINSNNLEQQTQETVKVNRSKYDELPKKLYFLVEIKSSDDYWKDIEDLIDSVESWGGSEF